MIEKVEKFYDEFAEEYDKELREHPFWKLYNQITWHSIRRFLPKNKNSIILDAGGGTGLWAIPLAKLGYKVVVTDISSKMLKVCEMNAKKKGVGERIETRKVDIKDMSCFKSNFFDMVIAQGDPVSYCGNPNKAVKEMSRVAKINTHVISSVDNRFNRYIHLLKEGKMKEAKRILKTGKGWFYSKGGKRAFPIHAFTPEELINLYKKHSLKVVKIIGKTVIMSFFDREERKKLLANREYFKKILKDELKFCEKLHAIGGHLEIVGTKVKK